MNEMKFNKENCCEEQNQKEFSSLVELLEDAKNQKPESTQTYNSLSQLFSPRRY